MSDVPLELQREILLRMPAESLCRFRSVCKSWLRTIDDPSFVRTHTTNNHRSSPNLFLYSTATAYYGTLYSLPLDSLNYINGQQTVHVREIVNRGEPWMSMCNGLLLFFHFESNKKWSIWNPLNDTLQELPQLDYEDEEDIFCLMGAGIGYDSNSDDYKVVRIAQTFGTTEYRTLIYSLKSNSWKRAHDCPHLLLTREALFFKGSLHWTSASTIVALDMATEEYRQLQMSPMMTPVRATFVAFGECLVMTGFDGSAWVMRGYGGEDPFWEELFSSEERRSVIGGGDMFPVAYNETQRRLILHNGNTIIRWDIGKRAVKRVTIEGLNDRRLYSRFVPGSLFRLNGGPIGAAAGTRSALAKRKRRSEAIKRLKLTATTIDS